MKRRRGPTTSLEIPGGVAITSPSATVFLPDNGRGPEVVGVVELFEPLLAACGGLRGMAATFGEFCDLLEAYPEEKSNRLLREVWDALEAYRDARAEILAALSLERKSRARLVKIRDETAAVLAEIYVKFTTRPPSEKTLAEFLKAALEAVGATMPALRDGYGKPSKPSGRVVLRAFARAVLHRLK